MIAKALARLRRRDRPQRPVRTPTILQMEALECGPAALAIVLAYHGRWVTLEELRVACGVSRNGSKASNLLRAARRYGLEAQGFKVEPAALAHLKAPLILHWDFSHFVVFEGFLRGDRVRINDPRYGSRKITATELDESMTGVVLSLEPGESFQAEGEPPRLLRALRRRLGGARTALAFVFLVSLLLVVPGLLTPAFSRLFIDQILLWRQASWLAPLLTTMATTAVVAGVLTWLQRSYLLRLETKMAVESSSRFLWHLLRLPLEFFQQRYVGDLSSRVAINDQIAQLLSRDLAVSALGILLILFFGAVMAQYDLVLTLVSVAVVSLNVVILRWVSRKRVDGNRRLLREKGKLTGVGLLGLEMLESLKASASESDLFSHWSGQQAKVVNLRRELEWSNQPLETLPPLLMTINTALLFGIGGLRVMEGELSLGTLVAFQILTFAFVAPVNQLVNLGGRLQLAEGEIGMLDDVQRAAPAIVIDDDAEREALSKRSSRLSGRLELRGVSFGYSPIDPPVLVGVELCLRRGGVAAVVGETGSGKSTLAKLVAGLYEPWNGEILFDDEPRRAIPRSVWSHSVAVVDQDVFVFEGSVRDNLTLWDATLGRDELLAACRDAAIADDVLARPGGFDSPMAEGGANWSGGQLQRLEIARALAGDPSLVILDEATSALDPQTEARIVSNLRRRGCTCLVIAHRLSTIRDADEILVLDHGRVVERGPHEELVRLGGAYERLVVHE